MKVYLVYDCFFSHVDYDYDYDKSLCGVYSSMELAKEACRKLLQEKMADCGDLKFEATFEDEFEITTFDKGEPYETNTFTIEEWCVQ